jgi:hypothetical protein
MSSTPWRYNSTYSSAIDGGEWLASRSSCYTPKNEPTIRMRKSLRGSRDGLEAGEKRNISLLLKEIAPRFLGRPACSSVAISSAITPFYNTSCFDYVWLNRFSIDIKRSRISLNSGEGTSHNDFPMTLTMWSVATNPLQFSFVHRELSPKCSSIIIHPFSHSAMKTFLYHATLIHDEALPTKCTQDRI